MTQIRPSLVLLTHDASKRLNIRKCKSMHFIRKIKRHVVMEFFPFFNLYLRISFQNMTCSVWHIFKNSKCQINTVIHYALISLQVTTFITYAIKVGIGCIFVMQNGEYIICQKTSFNNKNDKYSMQNSKCN